MQRLGISLPYPHVPRVLKSLAYHGVTIQDPYAWLEGDAKEALPVSKYSIDDFVEKQNSLTFAYLNSSTSRRSFRERLTDIVNYPRQSAPFRKGNAYYTFKNDGLQNQSVLYRIPTSIAQSIKDPITQKDTTTTHSQVMSATTEATAVSTHEENEEVILDPNTLSKDGTTALSTYAFDESGTYFAYGLSESGSDWSTIHIMNLQTKTLLEERLRWVKFSSISWTHDSKGFFYSRYPASKPSASSAAGNGNGESEDFSDELVCHAVYYHQIGTSQQSDSLIFATPLAPSWLHDAEVSDDGRYIILTTHQDTEPKNMLAYLPLAADKSFATVKYPNLLNADSFAKVIEASVKQPSSDTSSVLQKCEGIPVKFVVTKFESMYSYITNQNSAFYFRTNLDAPNYRLIKMDFSLETPTNTIEEVLKEASPDVLSSVSCVANKYLIAIYMHNVCEIMKLYDLNGNLLLDHEAFRLPGVGSLSELRVDRKFNEFFYSFTSFLYPGTIYRAVLKDNGDASTPSMDVYLQHEIVIPGFSPSDYATLQVFFPSSDGTEVPMFIIHPKSLTKTGDVPTYLYGYGGFSISITPSFSATRLVFLQQFNGIYCIANIRGGGEFGENWHKSGAKFNKKQCFEDFIAAAEYLVAEKYTNPSKIVIHGGSNGGLLVGAVATMRPDLFGAVIGSVGVYDMVKFKHFTIGHAWCGEYGDVENSIEELHHLLKISPYHNLIAQDLIASLPKTSSTDVPASYSTQLTASAPPNCPYPAIMLCTGDHDDRVVPAHSYKYISALQEVMGQRDNQINKPLLLRVSTKAGHGSGMPLSKRIEEQADMYTFIENAFGVHVRW